MCNNFKQQVSEFNLQTIEDFSIHCYWDESESYSQTFSWQENHENQVNNASWCVHTEIYLQRCMQVLAAEFHQIYSVLQL